MSQTASSHGTEGDTIREFRKELANKQVSVWRIQMCADRTSYRIWSGNYGKDLKVKAPVPVEAHGRVGQKKYVSAENMCRAEILRQIYMKLGKGFVEYRDGQALDTSVPGFSFDGKLSLMVRTPKPGEFISDEDLAAKEALDLLLYVIKYDGIGLCLLHHPWGWELYSLKGDCLTEQFPRQIEALSKSSFPTHTMLKAEAVMFTGETPWSVDFNTMNGKFGANNDTEKLLGLLEGGEIIQPTLVVYDCLIYDGRELNKMPYLERRALFEHLPAARHGNGLLTAAENAPGVTASNWRKKLVELGVEGFVVVLKQGGLGDDMLSYSSAIPRPPVAWKLLLEHREDIVVYAIRQLKGKLQSVFTKQRYPKYYPGTEIHHPHAGEWFYCGRIPTSRNKELLEMIEVAIDDGRITVVTGPNKNAANTAGEALPIDNPQGVVAVVYAPERTEANKFRKGQFVRPFIFDRQDKATTDCVATVLGERIPAQPADKV